jgi:hypothetical protein
MRAIEAELGFDRAEADRAEAARAEAARAEAARAEADRAEARQVVPRLGGRPAMAPPPLPPREASDDGQAPAGELDRVIGDMQVLLRYGHLAQVRDKLAVLRDRYPEDLLLMRRITEFHLESGDADGAQAALYVLAGKLYERRNFVGMRDALEQVLVLAPSDPRAQKLLGLLDEHPSTGTG